MRKAGEAATVVGVWVSGRWVARSRSELVPPPARSCSGLPFSDVTARSIPQPRCARIGPGIVDAITTVVSSIWMRKAAHRVSYSPQRLLDDPNAANCQSCSMPLPAQGDRIDPRADRSDAPPQDRQPAARFRVWAKAVVWPLAVFASCLLVGADRQQAVGDLARLPPALAATRRSQLTRRGVYSCNPGAAAVSRARTRRLLRLLTSSRAARAAP